MMKIMQFEIRGTEQADLPNNCLFCSSKRKNLDIQNTSAMRNESSFHHYHWLLSSLLGTILLVQPQMLISVCVTHL